MTTTIIINKENFWEKMSVLYNDLQNYWEIQIDITPKKLDIIEASEKDLNEEVLKSYENINKANFVKRW